MAEMLLFHTELEPGALPDCCIVCGAASCTPVKRTFAVQVADLGFVRKLRWCVGWMPLCPRHRLHFRWPIITLFIALGIMVVGIALGAILGVVLAKITGPNSPVPPFTALGIIVVSVVGGLVVGRSLTFRGMVHATNITDEGVQLENLADPFVAAVQAARTARPRKIP